MLSGS